MERDGAPDIHRFGWTTGAAARLVALAGRVGADPLESSDASLQRRLLVLMNVGTLPLTVLWSVTYFAAGPSPPGQRPPGQRHDQEESGHHGPFGFKKIFIRTNRRLVAPRGRA